MFLLTMGKAGPRAVPFVLCQQPEMRDAVRHDTVRQQVFDQQIISFAAPFGRKRVTVIRHPRKQVAYAHLDHRVTSAAQRCRRFRCNATVIHEHQPCLRFGPVQIGGDIDLNLGRAGTPDRGPGPILNVLDPRQELRRGGGLRLTGFDKILAALEGIGRQGHTLTWHIGPDLFPIHINAQRPETSKHLKEETVIRDIIIRMAQRRQDLLRRHRAMHPRQR